MFPNFLKIRIRTKKKEKSKVEKKVKLFNQSLVIVNFGILVPSSPGYFGVFQGMTILALMLYGVNKELALSISILIHFCQYIPVTLWGLYLIMSSSVKQLRKY